MLKLVATVNNRQTLFLGLARDNTERLLVDQPIAVDLQALMAQTSGGVIQDIILIGGETLEDVYNQLGEAMPLPPWVEPQP